MDYNLDTSAAKAADNINARIDQSGKYLGVLTRAEYVESEKGTKGVDLSFKADSGESADYLTIWTHNKDGKQLMGFNALMALMTCLRVRGLKATKGRIEKYSRESKQRETFEAMLYQDLMNKPIGLLLQMEEYSKTAGGTAWKPTIFGVFDKDEFTASEILDKATQPTKLSKMVLALKDKPLKPEVAKRAAPAASGHADDYSDLESDLPF